MRTCDGSGVLGTGLISDGTDQVSQETVPVTHFMVSDHSASEPHVCLEWENPHKQDATYRATWNNVQHDAAKSGDTSHVSFVPQSDIAAAREGSMPEELIIKMMEAKKVSDVMEVCSTGDMLEKAFQCGSIYENIVQTRQKTGQDMMNPSTVDSVSPSEQVADTCEASRLIINCRSRNKSVTSGRNMTTTDCACDGLSDETTSFLLHAQGNESQHLAADVSEDDRNLQLGDRLKVDACVQSDLMSSSSTLIVLPYSGEIQAVSSSHRCQHQIPTDDFTSRLYSNQEKIAALYIPANSQVEDINSAIHRGFIDSYTAEILKCVEIPHVVPDSEALNERFSSWLMYQKLRVDGCYHAADCITIENIPVPTEKRQLFISYLMMNSYIDPVSGQRVLVLDKQLTKMVKILLDGLILSENSEKSAASLPLGYDLSEQVDSVIPLHTNEETEELTENMKHTFDSHDFVSSINGRNSFDENTCADEKPLKQDSAEECDNATEHVLSEKTMFQDNTDWTKTGECSEKISQNISEMTVAATESQGVNIPASLESSELPTLYSLKSTNAASAYNTASRYQTPQHYDPASLCSVDVNPAETLGTRQSLESDVGRENAAYLLKAHKGEEGVLDLMHKSHYGPEQACKELASETAQLRLLHVQPGVKRSEKEGAVLQQAEQAVSDESMSSNTITEQQNHLISDNTISISQSELVTDTDNNRILYPKNSIPPEENSSHYMSVGHNLSLTEFNEAENTQKPSEREVAVMTPELSAEENDKKGVETEHRGAAGMSNYQSTPHSSYGPSMSSSSSEATAESIHHSDSPRLLVEYSPSQGLIESVVTDEDDVVHAEMDKTCNSDSESQTPFVSSAFHSVNSNSSPSNDDSYITGYTAHVGNQTVCRSELDMCSTHRNVQLEQSRTGNNTCAAHSPLDSDVALSVDYSSSRDSVESAVASVARGDWSYNKNITVDDSGIALPQQEVLCSNSDAVSEPNSQNGQRDRLPFINHENDTADSFDQASYGIDHSTSSYEIDPEHRGANYVHLQTERQHENNSSNAGQNSLSGNEQEHGPPSASSDVNTEQFESTMTEGLPKRKTFDVYTPEKPKEITNFLLDNSTLEDASSSALFYSIKAGVHDQGGIITKATNADESQRAQTQDTGNTTAVVLNDQEFSNTTPHGPVVHSHPDLLMDLLKPNDISSFNNKENTELILQEEKGLEKKKLLDAPGIQLQLLEVLKTVSSSQDLSMLQEVMDTLHSALGGGAQGDQWHTLESIKEESSEGEDEGPAEDDREQDAPHLSADTVACKIGEVQRKVHFTLS